MKVIQKERRNILPDGTLVVGTSPSSNSPRFAQRPASSSVRSEKRNMGKQNDWMCLVTCTEIQPKSEVLFKELGIGNEPGCIDLTKLIVSSFCDPWFGP